MKCLKCGKEISNDASYCKYCGAEVIKTDLVDGERVVIESKKRQAPHNKNALISFIFALLATLGCLLPLSKMGITLLIMIVIAALMSFFFRIKGKDEMYHLYDQTGLRSGRKLMMTSFGLSLLCLISAIVSMTRFL